jgi:urease accessory protein
MRPVPLTDMITDTTTTTDANGGGPGVAPTLLHLFHLVSPALPIGAYAYSQGLEQAVDAGWVTDERTALEWLQGLSRHGLGTLDLPLLKRLFEAWSANDRAAVRRWNDELIASRETLELREEERHLGQALARVLLTLGLEEASEWTGREAALATLFSLAAVRWGIRAPDLLGGYLWAWSENQVLAAVKLVPLGQSAGQRLLQGLIAAMPDITRRALSLADAEIGVGTPSHVLASMLHESLYSRLFRS